MNKTIIASLAIPFLEADLKKHQHRLATMKNNIDGLNEELKKLC